MDLYGISLRLITESDIPILYEILKEMVEGKNSSVHEKPLSPFSESEKYVKKYLKDNENHEIDYWYIIMNKENEIVGSVKISKKNYLSLQVLKPYRRYGIGTQAQKLLMIAHPRTRFFTLIDSKNEPSIKLFEKLGFKQKAILFEYLNEQETENI